MGCACGGAGFSRDQDEPLTPAGTRENLGDVSRVRGSRHREPRGVWLHGWGVSIWDGQLPRDRKLTADPWRAEAGAGHVGVTADGSGVSLWGDENVLEVD